MGQLLYYYLNFIMKNTALSKSRYTKYCQCPKALWLSVNKPDEATVDPSVEARFAEGNVVGDLAKKVTPIFEFFPFCCYIMNEPIKQ